MVWLCFNVIIFYMLHAVLFNKTNWHLWMGHALVLTEGLVLFAFNYVCPLTIVAHKFRFYQG